MICSSFGSCRVLSSPLSETKPLPYKVIWNTNHPHLFTTLNWNKIEFFQQFSKIYKPSFILTHHSAKINNFPTLNKCQGPCHPITKQSTSVTTPASTFFGKIIKIKWTNLLIKYLNRNRSKFQSFLWLLCAGRTFHINISGISCNVLLLIHWRIL